MNRVKCQKSIPYHVSSCETRGGISTNDSKDNARWVGVKLKEELEVPFRGVDLVRTEESSFLLILMPSRGSFSANEEDNGL